MGKRADATVRRGRSSDAVLPLVSEVMRRGLGVPALFLLEASRPFHLLIQQTLLVADPLLRPWSGNRLSVWAGLLDDDQALDEAQRMLADSLERRARPT